MGVQIQKILWRLRITVEHKMNIEMVELIQGKDLFSMDYNPKTQKFFFYFWKVKALRVEGCNISSKKYNLLRVGCTGLFKTTLNEFHAVM